MSRAIYKRFRNYVTSKIRTAKKAFYDIKFTECKNDIGKTWRLINSVIRPGHVTKKQSITKIIDSGVDITQPVDIVEKLNLEFSIFESRISQICQKVNEYYIWWLRVNYCIIVALFFTDLFQLTMFIALFFRCDTSIGF